MTKCDRDGARRVIRPVGRCRAEILAVIADREMASAVQELNTPPHEKEIH